MTGHDGSIYRICREAAGLTQEQAAEGLNCSVRSLARYESGEQHVPDDIAYQMVVLYDSQLLAVQHLRLVSHVAADLLPPVAVLDLPRAAIRIINQVRRFAERHRERELLDIAEDGVISPEERPLFDQIMEELHDLVQAIMELGLSEEGDGGHGERKRGIPGQPGADSGGIPRQGDPVSERDRPVVTYGQQNGQGELPDEGRRCAGGQVAGSPWPVWPAPCRRHKKRTPRGGHLEAFSPGTCVREQQQSYTITLCPEMQAPHGQGGGDSSMTGWEFIFVLLGVCTATSGLFRAIDKIEGR